MRKTLFSSQSRYAFTLLLHITDIVPRRGIRLSLRKYGRMEKSRNRLAKVAARAQDHAIPSMTTYYLNC